MISQPLDHVEEQLSCHFPEERKGIHFVIKILDEVITALCVLQPYDLIEQGPGCNTDLNACAVLERWGSIPARDIFDRYLKDQSLKDLLGSQGTSETEMSIVLLAQMWRFMSVEGIWYVEDGIEAIPLQFIELLRSFGGEIRLGERVDRIIVQDGSVTGVELAGGKIITAPLIISDVDYKETIFGLLPQDAFPDNEREEVSRMQLTSSAFTVFLGVKKELVDLSALRGDHLFVKLKEGKPVPWNMKKPVPEDFLTDDIWISWWSRHDQALASPECEALILKVGAPFEVFAPFSGTGRGRHQERYYSLKEELADALVAAAENILPGLSGAVVVREVATPLTYKYWGHRSVGSLAGWSWHSGEQTKPWARSLAVTKVSGLLIVGLQSFTRLFYGGMGTSMFSGKYASDLVLKKNKG
jgi:phytoene dehydrogenase-like protein